MSVAWDGLSYAALLEAMVSLGLLQSAHFTLLILIVSSGFELL